MSITLPDAAAAETAALAAQAAAIATAQASFIASTTVLINQAIAIGLPLVEPYLPVLVTSTYVIDYFTALGYAVLYPIYPPGPFGEFYPAAGFPEVVPPGNSYWGGIAVPGIPRIRISWGPVPPAPPWPYGCSDLLPDW